MQYKHGYPNLVQKKILTACIYTMNVKEEEMLRDNYREYMGLFEMLLCSFNTYQFDDYDKYVCEVFSKDEKADGDGFRSDEQVLAEWIAEETKGDLFAIRTARKYPTGYDDILEAGKQEKMEDARPILTSRLENLPDYRTIYFVYPNWWGDLPVILPCKCCPAN